MDFTALTLLWFRPLSPLKYALPESLVQSPWAQVKHIPIDVLSACEVNASDAMQLKGAHTWLLSSPTAAHLAASLGKPSSIAVMGTPTQNAWLEAGGEAPNQWHVSPTGESMGLLAALSQYSSVTVLRGKEGRNDLFEALRAKKINVHTVPIYEKQQHHRLSDDLNAALNQTPIALYMSSTDQPFRLLAVAIDKKALLHSPILVSHERIAVAARALGFQKVELHGY